MKKLCVLVTAMVLALSMTAASGVKAEDLEEILEGVKAGDAASMMYLGARYWLGVDVPKDQCQANYWYGEAAKRGNVIAHRALGIQFEEGSCVQRDLRRAAQLYDFSCRNGDMIGCMRQRLLAQKYGVR